MQAQKLIRNRQLLKSNKSINAFTPTQHIFKNPHISLSKPSINRSLGPHQHQQEISKDKIDHRHIQASFTANEKIKSLIENLYPTLDQIQKQQNKLPQISNSLSSKAQLAWKSDDYTSKQRLQNKVIMNHAQRQLDQRIKNRVLDKYKKLNTDFGEPYSEIFKKFKTQQAEILKKRQQKQFQCFRHSRYNPPEVTKEGLNLYPQIKNKVKLIDFMKQKIQQKRIINEQKLIQHLQSKDNVNSNCILKPLISRKRKQSLNQSKMRGKWKTQKQQQQLQMIKQIKGRLRKIYTRKSTHEPSEKTKNKLGNSNLLKEQYTILQQLQSNTNKVSNKSKEELLGKFNDILNQYTRSSTLQKTGKPLSISPDFRKHHYIGRSVSTLDTAVSKNGAKSNINTSSNNSVM